MTFDDQLHRAFDTLTDRLHADIRSEVQVAIDELASAHASREADLRRDIQTVRGAAAAELDEAVAASVAREAESVKTAREETMREAEAQHAERARASGTAAAERLLDAVRSIGRARSLGETLDTLVGCAAREAERAAVLTVQHGSLHGWRFIGFGALDEHPADAAAFEDRGLSERARDTNAIVQDERACAFPLALAGDVVAVLYATDGNVMALEILSRHAARSLEVLVAFKAARAMSAPETSTSNQQPATSDEQSDTDEVAARRYARLLVSEIRLYHEPEVVAGRRDRDLLSRLGGEIARARALYEQRIPPQVRQHSPYFDDELVRTLADGDATLLEVRT